METDKKISIESKATEARPAGFWIRFVASIIDGIVIGIVQFPFKMGVAMIGGFGALTGEAMPSLEVQLLQGGLNLIIYAVVAYFWLGWFYKNKGGGPGKLALGLKVLDDKTGEHCSYWKTFFRETIGKIVSSLIFLIGFLMAGFRKDKKGLHDIMFKTQVIKFK